MLADMHGRHEHLSGSYELRRAVHRTCARLHPMLSRTPFTNEVTADLRRMNLRYELAVVDEIIRGWAAAKRMDSQFLTSARRRIGVRSTSGIWSFDRKKCEGASTDGLRITLKFDYEAARWRGEFDSESRAAVAAAHAYARSRISFSEHIEMLARQAVIAWVNR